MTPPLARRENLLVEDLDDETVVYDLITHKAHCLSPATGAVWRHCEGATTPEVIAERVGATPEAVAAALHELGQAGLLVETQESTADGLSRRELIRGLSA